MKQKLSKQLKIDLDPDEHITLFPEQVTYNEIGDIDLYLQNRLRRHRGKLSAPQEGGTDEREVLRSELDEWDGETTERTRVDYAGVEDLTKVQIKQLGEYVASVNVVGDHCVPLRVSVVKRR